MSYGGGKQTVAMITLIMEGKLPKPDLIVFADTSREVQTTFQYLDRVVRPALKQIGLKVEICGHEYANWDITKDDVPGKEAMLLPAFTRQNGKIGKMPTFCSNEWKQRPIRRWLKERGVTDTDVWLGISLDEAERTKSSGLNWYRHVYPLIEIVPMSRAACVNQITRHGWEIPNKSRCYMCPNQSGYSFRDLYLRHDGDFDKAVALENEIRKKDTNVFFHPCALPLERAIDGDVAQGNMFDGCDSGYCIT
jgi:hypothetical protein